MKFVPMTETDVTVVLPAAMADGVSEIPPGIGLRTGNANVADVPPPGAGFTATRVRFRGCERSFVVSATLTLVEST